MKIVLASASPRRLEILTAHGITPIVRPADADETLPDEFLNKPAEATMYLASLKARAVYAVYKDCAKDEVVIGADTQFGHPAVSGADAAAEPVVIIGADTIVYKDRIIGKPADAADAFAILSSLRNASHSVITGVSLTCAATGEEKVFYDETIVTFGDYPDEEIRRFIREEPPFDKSGSYAVQSSWSKNITSVRGDIENVIGFPWKKISEYLREYL